MVFKHRAIINSIAGDEFCWFSQFALSQRLGQCWNMNILVLDSLFSKVPRKFSDFLETSFSQFAVLLTCLLYFIHAGDKGVTWLTLGFKWSWVQWVNSASSSDPLNWALQPCSGKNFCLIILWQLWVTPEKSIIRSHFCYYSWQNTFQHHPLRFLVLICDWFEKLFTSLSVGSNF